MADKIRINTGRLGADAEQIKSCIRAIEKEVEEIRVSAEELEPMWEGAGKEAFWKGFREDLGIVDAAVKGMQELCDYDRNAKVQYEKCGKKIGVLVGDLKV